MSIYLKKFGCPENFTNDWKKLHVTKWMLLCAGMAMAVSGYYIGSSLIIFDGGNQMWILCALFWGSAGICIVAYSIALIHLRQKLNIHRSFKYEETLNDINNSKFHNEDNGICTQRDKQISELFPTKFYESKPLSWLLNVDATLKRKYVDSNGAVKGMNGSYETCKARTLHTSSGTEKKVSNELSKCLNYKKPSGIFHQLSEFFNAVSNETFTDESHNISSFLEESSFTKFSKWEDQTSQLQNEIEFKGIGNNIHLVSEQQKEKCINEDIFHNLDMDIKINNSFQLLFPSAEVFEDPYFCKSLCEDETMKLEKESLVSVEQSKRTETEIFAFEFASFATTLLIEDLRSDMQQFYDKFLKTDYSETVNNYVKESDKHFWLKIPMKRSISKLTKKRSAPIILKNYEAVSENEPDIYHKDISLCPIVSAISENGRALLLSDSKMSAPEISFNSFNLMDELPTILIEDPFNSEISAEREMNFHAW